MFALDSAGYITAVTMDPEAQTLIIPAKMGGTDVNGIRAGVFSSYSNLKFVLQEVSTDLSLADGALDTNHNLLP